MVSSFVLVPGFHTLADQTSVSGSSPILKRLSGKSKNISHMWERWPSTLPNVAASLQKQLGQFLRRRRGTLTYPAFARKLGISSSSLHRMEMAEQNVTLNTLEQLLKRLKCRVSDVFDDSKT